MPAPLLFVDGIMPPAAAALVGLDFCSANIVANNFNQSACHVLSMPPNLLRVVY
jgi:uncharacterized membrane protein YphA (DoxX/SURF4 family)